jgi:hypothetical protein
MILTRILGGSTALLLIALLFVMARADSISDERDTLQTWQNDTVAAVRLASGQAELPADKVGDQVLAMGLSVETLKGEISNLNNQALARAAEFDRQKVRALEEIDRFKAAAAQSDRRIDRLRRLAQTTAETCRAPPELLRELEGL